MTRAGDLLSPRVVVGYEEDHLADVAARMRDTDALRCVVLEPISKRFRGVIRLAETALRASAGNRILADLVSDVRPLAVRAAEPADLVCELIERHGLSEVVVIDGENQYIGLVCAEDAFRWLLAENRAAHARLAGLHAVQTRLGELLERKVEQRTAELRAAVEAFRSSSVALSHDIRAPLRSIRGLAEILATEPASSDAAELALGIGTASQKLERLAETLLSRATRILGDTSDTSETVDLNEVWEDAVAFHAELLRERQAQVTKAGSLHRVSGAYVPLLQIITNLLTNAVKYVPEGRHPRIEASTEESAEHVVFRLRDNGRGISLADRDRLFRPFSRGSQVEDQPGSGLGLAIAQDASRLLRAELALESTATDGSVFSVRLAKAPAPSQTLRA
jgi:signal transduction histidine kinase